ncbi:MAG: M18 family aminopeptidase [Erysipelotrichaceae bacterium]|nr:M18 family aminopeptidase [Erysipelotrichaceae bacterium]MDD4642898.1 M18 family aminopeptidase [Erysipelotrichaceae bacterium]
MEKKYNDINQELMTFIDKTPNAFSCVINVKEYLLSNGFKEVNESDDWNLYENSKFFVIRNDSSIIACDLNDEKIKNGFNIVASHGDSPAFTLKPNAEINENDYLKLNTNGYGGMIMHSWLDRPLSLAGRVIVRKDGILSTKIIDIDKDLMIIPSQSIHQNREVNDRNNLNAQVDMLPILATGIKEGALNALIASYFPDQQVKDYDLFLYNRTKAIYCGLNDEFIVSPRLDNLACAFNSLKAFVEAENDQTNRIYCCFDNEEIGSLTQSGADSTFLSDVLNRICIKYQVSIYNALSRSMLISADNGHALHPNAPGKNDITNKTKLNKGLIIKHHVNYTTNALSSSIFKDICDKADVSYQDWACRSDLRNGATLGGISLSHVSVTSVDIGLPQLAMHAAVETMGSYDSYTIYTALKAFYQTKVIKPVN